MVCDDQHLHNQESLRITQAKSEIFDRMIKISVWTMMPESVFLVNDDNTTWAET